MPGRRRPTADAGNAATNKAQMKAMVESVKAQIAEVNKKIAQAELDYTALQAESEQTGVENSVHDLEHDELLRQFDIVRQEEKDLQTILTNCDREIEEFQETSKAEIRIFQKKVKHLMAANQAEFSGNNIEGEERVFQERREQLHEQKDPERTVNELRSDEKDLLLKNSTLTTNLRMDQDKIFSQYREEFERQAEAKRSEHEQRTKLMRNQLEERRLRETQELERRKNEQIVKLQERHKAAYERIKRFFSGVIHNNLEVIKQDKQKLAERNTKINAIRKDVEERASKKRKLEAPLNQLITENEKLKKEIEVYNKDKRDLKRNKEKIKVREDELHDLQLTLEVLEQRSSQLEHERDILYDKFENSIHDVRQKTEFRAYVLEQKVKKLNEELELKELELQRVMQENGLDSTAISSKIDDVMAVKNARINELEVELAKVIRARNDILTAFEAKMEKYGIPYEKTTDYECEPVIYDE